jgi:GATA zinc finger
LTDFVHVDDVATLRTRLADPSSNLAVYLRFRSADSRYLLLEFGARLLGNGADSSKSGLILAQARPYPGRTQEGADSFLELSLDNERLRHRLADVYADLEGADYEGEKDDLADGTRLGTRLDPDGGLVPEHVLLPSFSNMYGALGIGISVHPSSSSNNPPYDKRRSTTEGTGTRRKRRNTNAARNSDDDSAVAEGKCTKGGSEFVCRDCGTVDSPEWRRGPLGPKTLCNACGLVRSAIRSLVIFFRLRRKRLPPPFFGSLNPAMVKKKKGTKRPRQDRAVGGCRLDRSERAAYASNLSAYLWNSTFLAVPLSSFLFFGCSLFSRPSRWLFLLGGGFYKFL